MEISRLDKRVDKASIDDWVAEAQPGAQFCYFTGFSFFRDGDRDLGKHLRNLEDRGFLYLKQGPATSRGREHIIERSSRPYVGPSCLAGRGAS